MKIIDILAVIAIAALPLPMSSVVLAQETPVATGSPAEPGVYYRRYIGGGNPALAAYVPPVVEEPEEPEEPVEPEEPKEPTCLISQGHWPASPVPGAFEVAGKWISVPASNPNGSGIQAAVEGGFGGYWNGTAIKIASPMVYIYSCDVDPVLDMPSDPVAAQFGWSAPALGVPDYYSCNGEELDVSPMWPYSMDGQVGAYVMLECKVAPVLQWANSAFGVMPPVLPASTFTITGGVLGTRTFSIAAGTPAQTVADEINAAFGGAPQAMGPGMEPRAGLGMVLDWQEGSEWVNYGIHMAAFPDASGSIGTLSRSGDWGREVWYPEEDPDRFPDGDW